MTLATDYLRRGGKKISTTKGFTIVEILIVIVVIAILAAISIVSYNGLQRRSADDLVRATVSDAVKSLQTYGALNDETYPSNLADTKYAPPLTVPITLFTNAPQVPQYLSLTSSQNAQLFLNSCNGRMPFTDGKKSFNSCSYAGQNLHVKGTGGANIVIHGPTITNPSSPSGGTPFDMGCGGSSVCLQAQQSIIDIFLSQGGTFPVTVPKKGSVLPSPEMVAVGPASKFCVFGRSAQFPDIVYHASEEHPELKPGACDTNSLHYP